MAGVFFDPRPAAPHPPHPLVEHLAAHQLRAASGDGLAIQPEQAGHPLIAAMPPRQALQPSVQAALLFVQQTVKEHLGRLPFILRRRLRLARGPLLLPPPALVGAIKIAAAQFPAVEPALLHQPPQGVLGRHLHHRVQFVGEAARRGLGHQRSRRVQQRAVAGKVDVPISPQPGLVVLGQGIQGVIGAAMGVAGAIRQGGQFAEDGDRHGGSQGRFELGQRDDGRGLKQGRQPVGGIADCIHNVTIPPFCPLASVIPTF